MHMRIYIYIYIHIYMCICIYIERERERDAYIHVWFACVIHGCQDLGAVQAARRLEGGGEEPTILDHMISYYSIVYYVIHMLLYDII